jgi:hypothetical protein
VPLELLEYDVFRFAGQPAGWTEFTPAEIDCGVVPTGQTWRADRISVGVWTGLTGGGGQPSVLLYDQASPGPTVVPMDMTLLSQYPGAFFNGLGWLDSDDTSAPLTIQQGNELAVVFEGNGYASTSIFTVRVQFSKYGGEAGKPQPFAGGTPGPSIPVAL